MRATSKGRPAKAPPLANQFICIEGVDGSGKTTIARALAHAIDGRYFRTPSRRFRRFRGRIDAAADPVARFFFYLSSVYSASREIEEITKHHAVVCDRYIESTFAYCEAMGLSIPHKSSYYADINEPDVTIILHADEECLVKRVSGRRKQNVTDSELERNRTFQQAVDKKLRCLKGLHLDTTHTNTTDTVNIILGVLSDRHQGARHHGHAR